MTDTNSFKLVIEDDEGRRSVVPVELGEVSIGRLEGNTIRLKERNVSRHHARILKDGAGMVYAEDLDSYNGLWINGDRINGRAPVRDGDVLRIGDFQLELRGDGLHPRADDTTQRKNLGDADNTNPGMRSEDEHLGEEPTITNTQRTPATKPSASTEPEERFEPTAIIRPQESEEPAKTIQLTVIPAQQRAKLVCVSTGFAGTEYTLDKAEVVLGRTGENDIGIDHRSVSRHHAKIVMQGRRFKIIDLESANGTLVNGEPYAQTELKRGDVVELGHVKLRFVPPGDSYTLTAEEQAAIAAAQGETQRARTPKNRPLTLAVLGLAAAGIFVVIWHATGSGVDKGATPTPALVPVTVAPRGGGNEVDQLMVQAQNAVGQKNWKRAQTMANAVLALDPSRENAQNIAKQADMESEAQHDYDTAVSAIGQSLWSDAWNALQEIPPESCYYSQAMSLNAQVRPALITEHISDAREALKSGDFEQAQQLTDEVEGLDPTRGEIAELRKDIEDARKRHPNDKTKSVPHPPRKTLVKAPKPAPATPPTTDDPKALYVEGTKALTAGNVPKAIDDFTRCINADKQSALCYRALGIAYARSGNGPKAARFYRLYLKVDPDARDAAQVRQLLQQYESTQ